MFTFNWRRFLGLDRKYTRQPLQKRRQRTPGRRLDLEALEDRVAPAAATMLPNVAALTSAPLDFVQAGSFVYYLAKNAETGQLELWQTNGTTTTAIAGGGINGTNHPDDPTAVNGILYFTATAAGGHTTLLWQCDGTDVQQIPFMSHNNSQSVSFITPGPGSNAMGSIYGAFIGAVNGISGLTSSLMGVGTSLYFADSDDTLHVYGGNGTPTTIGQPDLFRYEPMAAIGTTLYFPGYSGEVQTLWTYNSGTGNSTPVSNSPSNTSTFAQNLSFFDLTAVGTALYFFLASTSGTAQLWRYANNAFTAISGPIFGGTPQNLAPVGSNLFFTSGGNLYMCSSTATTVTQITVGQNTNTVADLTAVNNTDLYFTSGGDLWEYTPGNGNTATQISCPFLVVSAPMAAVGNDLFFVASVLPGYQDLAVYDTSGATPTGGTNPDVVVINPKGNSMPANLSVVGSGSNATLYLGANDGTHGFQPWMVTPGPAVTITNAPNISNDNLTNVGEITGTGDSGDTITVSIQDSNHQTVSAAPVTVANGKWAASGINASSLADGEVIYIVTETLNSQATTVYAYEYKDTATPSSSGGSGGSGSAGSPTFYWQLQGTPPAGLIDPDHDYQGGEDAEEYFTFSNDGQDDGDGGTESENSSLSFSGGDGTDLAIYSDVYDDENPNPDFSFSYDHEAKLEWDGAPTAILPGQAFTINAATTATSDTADQFTNRTGAGVDCTVGNYIGSLYSTLQASHAGDQADNDFTFTAPSTANGAYSTTGGFGTYQTMVITEAATIGGQSVVFAQYVYNLVEEPPPAGITFTAPPPTITSTAPNINNGNLSNVTVSGTGTTGDFINVTIKDHNLNTATTDDVPVTGGSWTVSGIDAGGLAAGPITYIVTETDGNGNSDTIRFRGATLGVLSVTQAPNIDDSAASSVLVSGTGISNGDPVTITATDGTNTTLPVTATVTNDTWTAYLDASPLDDGLVTYEATEGSFAYADDAIESQDPPTVTGVSPDQGSTSGGTAVAITGTDLENATEVLFGSTAVTTFSGDSATSITLNAPAAAAGLVDVQVVTAAGTSPPNPPDDQFTFVAATPTVTGVSPPSGPPAGGTAVTITGTSLADATAVMFGSTRVTNFISDTPTSIILYSPAATTGAVDVQVETAGGTSAVNAPADQFVFEASPTVTSVSPGQGPTSGGAPVTITGANLAGATAVMFGSIQVTSFTSDSATSITLNSPASAAGTVDVQVVTASGTSPVNAPADQFTFVAATPTVSGVSPSSGPIAGGTSVTITGANLANATAVKLGSIQVTTFTSDSATSITFNTPAAAAPGTVDVQVVTAIGASPVNAPADQFTFLATPTVTGVSPASGPIGGGTLITISGANLANATAVKFGSTQVSTFTSDSATSITLNTPAAAAGVVDVQVVTASGTSAVNAPVDQFTFLAAPPTVTGVSVSQGPISGGTTITITGTNLANATAVNFGSVQVTSFTSDTATSITLNTPTAAVGAVDVQVVTASGASAVNAPADQFAFVAAPTVTGVFPSQGSASGGTIITITGVNLANATAVKFGSLQVTSFASDSATSITLSTPAGTVGPIDVQVATAGGASAVNAPADQFTFLGVPTVTGVSPSQGPGSGGTAVTITGTDLANATAVDFGVTAVTSFTSDTATSITLNSPLGAGGTVDVRIVVNGVISAVNAPSDQFTFVAAPTITGISPATASGGTAVTISGTNLANATAVHFGATLVTSFTSDTATSIVLNAPAAAGTVDVQVVTPGGTSAINEPADEFTFLAPSVSGVSPAQGPAAGGTTVTITGTDLANATAVDFGSTQVTNFTSDTATSIVLTSPAGTAGAVDVRVVTPGGTSAVNAPADQFSYNSSTQDTYSGTLSGNQTWDSTAVRVITGNVDIAAGATLTIQAGTVIKFNSANLIVDGTLNAQGSLFTSNQANPNPNDWGYIEVDSGGSATLNDDQVQYGGNGGQEILVNGSSSSSGAAATLTLTNSVIENSSNRGVRIQNSNPVLTNDTFVNNGTSQSNGAAFGAAISMDLDSNPQISGFSASAFSNNRINGLAVDGGTIPTNGQAGGQLDWNAPNVAMWMTGNINVPASSTLTIAAGQVVKVDGANLDVNGGTLTANGSATQEIYFTSEHDDSVGGNTDNLAGATAPAPNDWTYLEIDSGGSATLNDVDLRYGGNGGQEIYVNGPSSASSPAAALTLANSIVEDSSNRGLRIQDSNPILTNDTFNNNGTSQSNGAYYGAAISMDLDSSPQISGFSASSFSNNKINGLELDGGTVPTSRFNSGSISWNAPNVVLWLSGNISVPTGTTVTIAAGQVVKVDGVNLDVNGGTLTANGTTTQEIYFTSEHDDSVGGNTDNLAGATAPAPNDWTCLEIDSGGSATLNYVDLRYGGNGGQEIYLNGSSSASSPAAALTLSNSIVEESSNRGLRIQDSNPVLTSDTFNNNGASQSNGAYFGAAISMDGDSNPHISGFSPSSFSGNKINGLEVDGTSIAPTGHAGGQITWNAPNVVLWMAGNINVPTGTSLTIAAGQVVKVDGANLDVNGGTLTANGSATQEIYFTSEHDDTVGGNTDNLAGATAPAPNDWTCVEIDSGGSATLNYVDLRYGGNGGQELYLNGPSSASSPAATLTLTNSIVEDSSNRGLRIQDSNPILTNDTFNNNGASQSNGAYFGAAISMDDDSNPQISGFSPSSFSGNKINGLEVDGATISATGHAGGQITWNAPNVVLWLAGNINVPTNTTLTIAAGQVIKVDGGSLDVNGGVLTANGGAGTQQIDFTSTKDDSLGGDTNNVNATTPAPGDWGDIEIDSGGSAVINHVALRYGGGGGQEIFVNGGALTLTKSVLSFSSNKGLFSQTTTGVQVVNNLIYSNAADGIQLGSGSLSAFNNTIDSNNRGVEADGGTLTLTNNLITNSTDSGVFVSNSPTVTLNFNDVFNSGNRNYNGLSNPTGANGNVSVNPLYVNAGQQNYQLSGSSPVIGVGMSTGAPSTDIVDASRHNPPTLGAYEYLPPSPTVIGISPSSDGTTGGAAVTIIGSNLGTAATVTVSFGGNAASITSDNGSTLVVSSPAGTGSVAVTVTTAGGMTTAAQQFTYVSSPSISSVTPIVGPVFGGVTVTITGANLGSVATATVSFGGNIVSPISDNGSTLVINSPAGTAGPVNVTVSVGGATVTASQQFTYFAAPNISGITPSAGAVAGGTSVTISGANLGTASSANVTFGGQPASIISDNGATLVVSTPAGAVGQAGITVTTPGGTATASQQFSYVVAPTISGFSPGVGPLSGGTAVTIIGTNLGSASVSIGGNPASIVSDNGSTLVVVTPSGTAAGTVSVTVTTPGGSASVSQQFTYVAAPTISGISPAARPLAGGTAVTISGANLQSASVTIGGNLASVTSGDGSTLVLSSPAAAVAGAVSLIVTTLGGSATASQPFTYFAVPSISGINATMGSTVGGTTVTISGSNLGTAAAAVVSFGGNPASITSDNGATLVVSSPAGAAGPISVTVATPGGTATASQQFTYVAVPSISGISPSAGPLSGDSAVTITGANLGSASVSIGGIPASITSDNGSALVVVSPAGITPGSVSIIVTTSGGIVTAGQEFTYVAAPSISGITPSAGPLAGGTTVTISGTNLGSVSNAIVSFGGQPASVNSDNGTTLVVSSPAEAAGLVSVTVATPGGSATAAQQFTYAAAPTVSGISPGAGPLGGGTVVTLTGTNLGSATVTFGGRPASVTSANGSTLVVVSPAGASLGAVNVTLATPGGSLTLSGEFTYVPAPTLAGITPTTGALAGGASVTITGTNLGSASVSFGGNPASVTSNNGSSLVVTSPAGAAAGPVALSVTTPGGTVTAAQQYFYVAAPTAAFSVTLVRANASVLQLTSVAAAKSLLTTASEQGAVYTAAPTTINYLGTGPIGHTFPLAPAPFPGTTSTNTQVNLFAVQATANVIIPSAGNWTFGASSDDGVGITVGGLTLERDGVFPPTDTFQTFDFTSAGAYALNMVYYQNTGGAEIELFAAQGTYTSFNSNFELVGDTADGGLALGATAAPAPTVSGVSPSSGPLAGGTTVTITGANLANAAQVDFGTTVVTSFTATPTSITLTSPAATIAGPVDVRVVNPGGPSAVTSADQFTYVAPPTATVQFSSGSETVNESAGTFSIPVTLSSAASTAVSIPFTLSGSATAGSAYSGLTSSPLVIPAGQTSAAITGALLADPGAIQTLTFTMGTPSGANLGSASANTLTITEPAGTAPSVLSALPTGATTVTSAQLGATFKLAISYNQAMKTTKPTITFSPSVAPTLTFVSGAWTSTRLYTASYKVGGTGQVASGVLVTVTGAQNTSGITQVAYTSPTGVFSIDTASPTVTSLTPSTTTISDATLGRQTFALAIQYGTSMNTAVNPTVSLSASANSTLSVASESWNTATLFSVVYNVADAFISVASPPVTVTVSGAKDVNGNTQATKTGTFAIDTVNPTVKSVTPSAANITGAQEGSATFSLTVNYSGRMNTAVAPTINFIPTIDSTLSLASAGTWNSAGTGYTQTYNVADSGMNIPGVSVAVSGAQNSDGNLQHAFEAVNNFTINTINPIVLSATPSTTAITAAGTNAFKLVLTYSTAMNTTVAPTIAFSPTVSALQSGTGSGWDSTHKKYTAVYNVANAATNVSGIVATISGGESSSSSLVLASFQSSPFSINVGSTPNISVTETNTSVSYNSQYFGESFVAPVSGPLTQLNVLYITNLYSAQGQALSSTPATIQIYSGGINTNLSSPNYGLPSGNLIDQQSFTFAVGTNNIVFTSPPNLVAGQTYVWQIVPSGVSTIYANFATNNPYTQGDVLGSPGFGYDLDFQIFI